MQTIQPFASRESDRNPPPPPRRVISDITSRSVQEYVMNWTPPEPPEVVIKQRLEGWKCR